MRPSGPKQMLVVSGSGSGVYSTWPPSGENGDARLVPSVATHAALAVDGQRVEQRAPARIAQQATTGAAHQVLGVDLARTGHVPHVQAPGVGLGDVDVVAGEDRPMPLGASRGDVTSRASLPSARHQWNPVRSEVRSRRTPWSVNQMPPSRRAPGRSGAQRDAAGLGEQGRHSPVARSPAGGSRRSSSPVVGNRGTAARGAPASPASRRCCTHARRRRARWRRRWGRRRTRHHRDRAVRGDPAGRPQASTSSTDPSAMATGPSGKRSPVATVRRSAGSTARVSAMAPESASTAAARSVAAPSQRRAALGRRAPGPGGRSPAPRRWARP